MNKKTKQNIIQSVIAGDLISDIANKNKVSDKAVKEVISELLTILTERIGAQDKKNISQADIVKASLILEVKAGLMSKGYSAEAAESMMSNISNMVIDENTSVEVLMTAVLLKAKKADLLSNKKGVTIMTSGISQVIDAPKADRPKKKRDDGVFKL